MQVLYEGLADSKYRPCPLLVKYVEAGWLGRKTNRGFYDYRGEKPVPDALNPEHDRGGCKQPAHDDVEDPAAAWIDQRAADQRSKAEPRNAHDQCGCREGHAEQCRIPRNTSACTAPRLAAAAPMPAIQALGLIH